MRIRSDIVDSNLGSDGAPIITSFTVLAATATATAAGKMASREDGYAQINDQGTDVVTSAAAGTWYDADLGNFPEEAVVLLTDREISITRPGSPGVGAELNKFWTYSLVRRPSATFPAAPEGTFLPWRSYPTAPVVRGLFAEVTDVFPVLAVADGCLWVALAGGVTAIDFGTDYATIYQVEGARMREGLNPGTIPDDPYGPVDASLALPNAPYRSVSTYSERSHSWAAVGGGEGVSLLRKDTSVRRSQYLVVETVDLGFEVNDVKVFPNGVVLAVGTEVTDTPGVGDLRWAWRSSISASVFGAGAWGDVQSGLLGFTQPMPRIARDGRWVWVSAGAGNIFRFETPEGELTADLRDSGILPFAPPGLPIDSFTIPEDPPPPPAELQYWAGPSETSLGGPPPPAEPTHMSVDTCSLVSNLTFDKGFPVVMLQLSPSQNSGSLMCVFDRGMRQILWRRRFRSLQVGVLTMPFVTPGSSPIEPGHTKDPAVGYGPDDPELA